MGKALIENSDMYSGVEAVDSSRIIVRELDVL